jgi:ATP-dependent Clp protease ATP-binding subunit ClpX
MNDETKRLLKHKGDKLTIQDIDKLDFGDIVLMKYSNSDKLILGEKTISEYEKWVIEGIDETIILTWSEILLLNSSNYEVYTYNKLASEINDYKFSVTDKLTSNAPIVGKRNNSLFDEAFNKTFTFNATTNLSEADKNKLLGKDNKPKIPSPKEIKQYLDEFVIGQEEAKKSLSVLAYQHMVRINTETNDGVIIEKNNALLIGASGSGKTLLCETLSKFLDIPFITFDCSTLSPEGFVGNSCSDIIKKLYNASNGDIKKAEHGIVMLDEIDKLSGGSKSGTDTIGHSAWGTEVQSSILKMIENADIEVDRGGIWGGNPKSINTKNIMFLCAGAFSGIEKYFIKDDELHNTIGFGADNNKDNLNKDVKTGEYWNKITHDHISRYGLSPELCGRLSYIIPLNKLTKEDLLHILTEPKNNIISQYKKLMEYNNIELTITKSALELIVENTINKLGARGLRGEVDRIMQNVIYNMPVDNLKRKVIINDKIIKEHLLPKFKKIN